jgi:hypothetical protein
VTAIRQEQGAPNSGRGSPRTWLVGPWFDLFLIANVAWPIVVLAQFGDDFDGRAGIQFWQVYFVTTPHRWVTLLLVFTDRERFGERRVAFLAIAACIALLCVGVRLTTGALTCLLAIDYVWNAWHFASQHHGVYRIYRRLSDTAATTASALLEKWAMRGFLLYVILRIATATWSDTSWEEPLRKLDWVVVVVPVWLVIREFATRSSGSHGTRTYLISMCCLYLALLWAVHDHRPGLVLTLATASALFHAIEYLALVSWSVRQRHSSVGGRMGLLGYCAPRWGLTLAIFVLVLGSAGWLIDQEFLETWLLINVIVAFLHYAYDGMIWRRRYGKSVSAAGGSHGNA